jgi:hypothetical protein
MEKNIMKTYLLTLGATAFIALSACNNAEQKSSESNSEETEQISSESNHTDFLDEILLGYEMSAISTHMVQTPFKFLGATDLLMNYEAQDQNQVHHFVSFHKHKDDPNQMSALVYNLDFKKNNAHLVMEYQQKLIEQLEAVYGEWAEDFQTGFNNDGNYEAEWYFEAGVLLVTVGTDFISVDLREH